MKEVVGPALFIGLGILLIIFNRHVGRWTELSYSKGVNNWFLRFSHRFALTRALTLSPKYYHLYWIGVGILMVIVGVFDLALPTK